ncbi:peptidylprolyl isomerase [Alkalilimnicola ehrlichii]|uniref:Peptidyl-prolyl cis-trans isomerase n=1 Tax=Alkalilimnicola ehrlichii TaxID=351052 RepID=A0A3E0WMD3_9GAMM|nr:peptidylprolyl isomerase [Alkalilimnicola ehrlichii]RFA25841.1 peptidylprolyl isomerase [Alkalilimnicola ehrlichii]RFA33105.1 peptidylprolyl isomerase [Alkalilimnicola ehrlichii]
MQIAKDKVVSIEYSLKDDEGTLLDTSEGRDPLAYLHGAGNIIPGLESALEGKQTGDSVDVRINPEDAYGERNDQLQQVVPKELFQGVDTLEPGMQFQAQTEAGAQIVTIKEVDGDNVTVDANHPLAGVPLNFSVNVVEVRDATAEELEHGHVHNAQ